MRERIDTSRRLRRAALLLLATLACGGGGQREYASNDLQLITAYTAKEMCSCLFVMGHTEEYCRVWTRQSPSIYSLKVDRDAQVVESTAAMLWSARAHFQGERFGCILE